RENPFAREAEQRVINWLESLGCAREDINRARRFDAAGYVGIPFPTLPRDKTIWTAKYLSLWLLWDDVQVETLDDRWRIDAAHVLSGCRPMGMTCFDEGWWQLLRELAVTHSPRYMRDLCDAMAAWSAAAVEEATAMQQYRDYGVLPTFDWQMESRS